MAEVTTAVAVVAVGALVGLVLLARRLLLVVTVSGRSMEPTLPPGARVLVLRRTGQLRTGQVVVLRERPDRDPARSLIVKRVAAVAGEPVPESVLAAVDAHPGDLVPAGSLVLLGDGVLSADSRNWGYAPLDGVVGVMTARLS